MSLLTEALRALDGKRSESARRVSADATQQVRAEHTGSHVYFDEPTYVAAASFAAPQSECAVVVAPDEARLAGSADSADSPVSILQLPPVTAPTTNEPATTSQPAERFELFDQDSVEDGVDADDLELLHDPAQQADTAIDGTARAHDVEPPQPKLDIAPAYRDARLRICQQLEQDGYEHGQPVMLLLIDVATGGAMSDCGEGIAKAFVEECAGDVAWIDAQMPAAAPDGKQREREHGLTSLLDGTRRLAQVVADTHTARLKRVDAGLPKGPQQQVDAGSIQRMLSDCREAFQCTVVCGDDCRAAHLLPIARGADGVYLVIRQGITPQAEAKEALKHLDHAGIGVRGCLVVA